MTIIPSVNLMFYLFGLLALLLVIMTLIVLLRSKRARRVKALFFGGACCLQLATIAIPLYMYSNKPAPLTSPALLVGIYQDNWLVGLDARDGSIRWTHETSGAPMRAAAGSGKVFYTVSPISGEASAVNAWTATSGTQIWQTILPPNIVQNLVVSGEDVLVDEELGATDEVVYALHANDGSMAWKYTANFPDLGSALEPLLITAGNGLVFVRARDGGFSALRVNDGSLAWHFAPDIPQGRYAQPYKLALAGHNVYFLQSIAGDQNNQDVSLLAFSQENGKILWQKHLQALQNYALSLVCVGTHLYMGKDGRVSLLNALNGTQFWQRPLYVGSALEVTEANGVAYIPGNGAMNALDERDGKLLWSLDADPDGNFTKPVLFQNVLFASAQAIAPHGFYNPGSGHDAVVAIDPARGSVYWSTTRAASLIGMYSLT